MAKVKICGVTTEADARFAASAGAWAVGVNFWPQSRRFVEIERAAAIAGAVGGEALVVGVFVDASREEIESAVERVGLDAIQLHGDESADDCLGWSLPVIKAVRMRDGDAWQRALAFPSDYILADAYVAGEVGGSGRPVALDLVGDGARERLILAGGLDADSVAAAVRRVAPFAVDVASGVESRPGRKDAEKVKRFIDHAHAA